MPILADTSVLVAAAVERESRHGQAREAIESHGTDGVIIPLSILTETLGFVLFRYGPARQRAVWSALMDADFEILPVDAPVLKAARDIDQRYEGTAYGFVDCTLLAACEELRIARILSFDARLASYRPSFAPALELLP